MEYELIINPQLDKYHPERYKAVLLLNGGLSKGYPKDMDLGEILDKVSGEIHTYGDGSLKNFICN